MRWTFLLLLLLCACATQRQAEEYFDRNPDKLAAYVDQNEAYTRQYGQAYATKHFPPKFYPPAVYSHRPLEPGRLATLPALEPARPRTPSYLGSPAGVSPDRPAGRPAVVTRTVYLQDTARVDSLHRELEVESLANQALRKRLTDTEADRDYWQEKNEQKFWTLIAMAVFAFLYIFFKVLASRIRET